MSDLLDFSPPGQVTFSLAGARARFFNAGTTTPRTVYADQAETVPHPVPLLADGSGRFPQAFVSGSPVKVVVTQADESTGYTLDPCEKVAASGAGAAQISFAPTGALPQTNVQAAIEAAAASAASGFTPFGLGIAGNAPLLANIDATTIASGQYRFDGTTTGTYPTGVAAADTGAVGLVRETSGSAWQWLYHDTTDRLFIRRMTSSTWGAWRENITANIGAAQGDIIFRGASGWTRLAAGSAGGVLRSGGPGADPSWGGGVETYGTPVATTSGTSIDFTGIPSTARRVRVLLAGVSTNGTGQPMIQIGDSGGIETTGYIGNGGYFVSGAASSATANSSGFVLAGAWGATSAAYIEFTLTKPDAASNQWLASFCGTITGGLASGSAGGGAKTLSDTLDRVRLTTIGGVDTFDAGTVNISWE